jgi:hypothetical protein
MKTILLSLLAYSLILCTPARADLANCFVLRGGDSLGRVAVKKLRKTIHDAYQTSRDSDVDVMFLLEIDKRTRPKGGYTIRKASLVLGESWTIQGCRISASDLKGMQNGVAEICKAMKKGSVLRLKTGPRKGLLAKPLYDK